MTHPSVSPPIGLTRAQAPSSPTRATFSFRVRTRSTSHLVSGQPRRFRRADVTYRTTSCGGAGAAAKRQGGGRAVGIRRVPAALWARMRLPSTQHRNWDLPRHRR
jgi:hypothetical protein